MTISAMVPPDNSVVETAPRGAQNRGTGITFQEETLHRCLPEATKLLKMHWNEICHDKQVLRIDTNIDAYHRLEHRGVTLLVTARDGKNLVGYVLLIIDRHLHYKGSVFATDDLHFLHPKYRKGSAGVRMLKHALALAKVRGATYAALRTKASHDHGKLFERLGLRKTDIVYTGRL